MRKRPRNLHRTRTPGIGREELVDAAVAVIRREGAGASMDSIAAEAGITKPILYRRFGDRGGLVDAVAERFVGELLSDLRDALASDLPPKQILTTAIDAYLSFVEREPEIWRFLVLRTIAERGAERGALTGFVQQICKEITVVLGEQLRATGADSGPAEPWAYGIVGMVHLSGEWWSERRTLPRERLVSYLSDLLWHGFEGVVLAELGGPRATPGGRRGRIVPLEDRG